MVAVLQNIAFVAEMELDPACHVQLREHCFVWISWVVSRTAWTGLNVVLTQLLLNQQNPRQQKLSPLQIHQLTVLPFVMVWIVELQETAVTHNIVTAVATVWCRVMWTRSTVQD